MVMEIPLSRGQVALVDDADYPAVMAEGKWFALSNGAKTFYAARNAPPTKPNGKRRTLTLHHFLTGWDYVDHVNGDGLDNRRSNLRWATHAQNMANQDRRSTNQSGFKGVHPKKRRWAARIQNRYLGTYATPEDAAHAYDEAAIETWGEFARLNFPSPE